MRKGKEQGQVAKGKTKGGALRVRSFLVSRGSVKRKKGSPREKLSKKKKEKGRLVRKNVWEKSGTRHSLKAMK